MGDRCCSVLVCAERDKDGFEKMGYRLEESKALSADGKEIPGAVVMVDEQANYGHYDELTVLTDIPFLVCGSSCPGAYGDHLIVSDGKEWHHSEALHESNYQAVRVEFGGVIRDSEVDDARKYWRVYSTAMAAIKRAALKGAGPEKGSDHGPLEIRNRLGLKTGDRVEFVVDKDRTTIRPARAPENTFLKYIGVLPAFSSIHEANAWVRTLRDEEAEEQ